ncbi:RnfABCDGE type electron transport complex subunit B [Paucidesulfovibrio longus]|uniref:RnfABCDGE type electron transport complex subunit B n=1 Tax=Paucidesulfovibrio longus TaxID=889 RepID=UPI0003B37393|nr:RnfABCDGE type electron transport complex subunit B [Paucidesulfovibrio longus]
MIASSVAIVFGLSFVAAVLLAAASRVFHVEEDPRVAEVEACLPGANCGGCGLPGCSAAAAAVVAGEAPPEICVAGGMDTAAAIARVMGLSVDYREPQVAALICSGGDRAKRMFAYEGVRDCRAEAMLYGGEKSCGLGCIGMGSCVRACPFDAVRLGRDNLPVVNKALCRSCGKCAEVCPTGAIRITSFSASLLHVNKLVDCLAPCMQKCPVQLDVRTFVQQVKTGDLHGALLTLKNRNPLPLIVGRICPHPCEDICRRKIVDEGVGINALERYVADWEMNTGRIPIHVAPETGRKVAIVGGGPAGLSCAYFLRRLGHHPVIFESHSALGGMLRYAIPEFRLPRNVVDWEIQGILELGVEVRTYMTFGKDFDLGDLESQGYEAVFLATGAWRNPRLYIPGDDARNIVGGVDFLTGVGSRWTNLKGRRAVVVGGTNSAMDIARSLVRLGAERTSVLTRHIPRKMAANKYEIEKAEEIGAEILVQTMPQSFELDESGRAVAVRYVRTEYPDEKKAAGEPRPVPGTEARLEADLFVVATDRVPDLSPYLDKRGLGPFRLTKQGTIIGDDMTMRTNLPHVFVGGELRRGRSIVMEAVADGRRAARSIHNFVTTGDVPMPTLPQERVVPESLLKGMRVRWRIPKVQPSEVPVKARLERFALEVRRGIGDREAVKEASRCLRCGFTCYDAEAGSEFAEDRDVTPYEQAVEN